VCNGLSALHIWTSKVPYLYCDDINDAVFGVAVLRPYLKGSSVLFLTFILILMYIFCEETRAAPIVQNNSKTEIK
jgi:hypothetical protein